MKRSDTIRVNLMLAGICILFGAVVYRLFVLAYVRHGLYARTAQSQSENISQVLARGNIYLTDKNGQKLIAATTKKFPILTLVPAKISPADKESIIKILADASGIKEEQLRQVIGTNDDYAHALSKHLENQQVEQVKSLGIKGVGIAYDTDRFYPNNQLAADVIGFLGYQENRRTGQYGVESFYDEDLSGRRDATIPVSATIFSKLSEKFLHKSSTSDQIGGIKDIVLTIDQTVQAFAENTLDETIRQWSASGGSIIIQEPTTGKIIAMIDRPNFNPNAYSDSPIESFLNGNVQQIFEPGSSFKPITMAMGLDLGKVTPQTTFEDTGAIDIAGYHIKNFSEKVFGVQNMAQVLEKSINTGAMFVEKQVGDDNFLNYLINFGFGQRTGIDLPGEINGDITNLYSGRKINYLTASFGQGMAVTPLQLVTAYSALANGGKLMRPYVVDRTIDEHGTEVVTKPEIMGIPISEKTSAKIKTMLVGVVDSGFDKARIKGYDIAGKTGTAQIPASGGGYIEGQFIHDFLGFAPAYNPKFVIMIKMDKPQGITFAADSLSPTFRKLADFLLQYYNIPPTR